MADATRRLPSPLSNMTDYQLVLPLLQRTTLRLLLPRARIHIHHRPIRRNIHPDRLAPRTRYMRLPRRPPGRMARLCRLVRLGGYFATGILDATAVPRSGSGHWPDRVRLCIGQLDIARAARDGADWADEGAGYADGHDLDEQLGGAVGWPGHLWT